ncbi:MAG: SDR family oxidoreductase [Burkholderiaceae bacterium]
MASILGAVGFAGAPAYAAAKHGVVGLMCDGGAGVQRAGRAHQCRGPGFIHTPMIRVLEDNKAVNDMLVAAHPIGRLDAEEVAELVLWLSSEKPRS